MSESLQDAIQAHRQGDFARAEAIYQRLLAADPRNAEALQLIGVIALQQQRHAEAVEQIAQAIAIQPGQASFHSNLGMALSGLGQHDQALASYNEALRLQPDYPEAFNNRGNTLRALQRLQEALASYDAAIRLKPDYAEAFNSRGIVLFELQRFEDALSSHDQALRLQPDHASAHFHLGNALRQLKRSDEALRCYEEAIRLQPSNAAAFNNRGSALIDRQRLDEALSSYNEAIRLQPNYAAAFSNRGIALSRLRRFEESLASFDEAIRLQPEDADAFNNRGNTLIQLRRYEEALSSFNAALCLKPNYPFVAGWVAHLRCHIGQWSELVPLVSQITQGVSAGEPITPPFPLLALVDDPRLHRQAAATWLRERKTPTSTLGPLAARPRGERIHLAYLSADFHNHATSYLMAELFELHDRDRFELTAISFGPTPNTTMRQRVSAAFDRFEEVSNSSDIDVARLCREIGVDLAVDLKGFTGDSRVGILAHRCAPIQINWLGYPGTMAAPFIDYIVADRTLISEDDLADFSEKLIWLPDSYQVNDGKRRIADKVFSRAECGLPETGFVFCCFNNNHKILPSTFAVWMRILQRVPGSVLWLLEGNPAAAANLRREALSRGIAAERLVFARKLPLAEHLARHRLADLFIDTWPYNAHTTASDALWAGLPVLTRAGRSFASRVGASLLTAIGLPELITRSDQHYEDLAVALAQDPLRLQALRQRLAANRLSQPLFNCERFTRSLESAFVQVMERHWAGAEPDHLAVAPASVPAPPLAPQTPPAPQTLEAILGFETRLELMDIGAACIAEVPVYRQLIERGIAHLHVFEGDQRQIEAITATYGERASVYPLFLFDGSQQTAYLASEASGMTSLLKPRPQALAFFNRFEQFGTVLSTANLQTQRLDDIAGLPPIDFLKMDIQGAELTVMKHGLSVLERCVAIQLEVSFIALYEDQPTFGEVDVWMRSQGFVPHCFLDVKRWSIAPTLRNNNFRVPFNQLLEADIVYIRDPLSAATWSDDQLRKLALIAHDCFASSDLAIYLLLELDRRHPSPPAGSSLSDRYLALLNAPSKA